MKLAAVFTDLDGTMLEPDGTVRFEARRALASLLAEGVAVCPVTSKTPAELGVIMADLEIRCPAGFENGAGIRHADGTTELCESAVPVAKLREVIADLRAATGVPLRSLDEIHDEELAALTGLSGGALARVRQRYATLPLIASPRHDRALHKAIAAMPELRLVRGNRFLHLQGNHDKADVLPRLASLLAVDGTTVACGDAPNDVELLAAASVRVIVPGRNGPSATLRRRFPDAIVAPHPHGKGWAAALRRLMRDGRAAPRRAVRQVSPSLSRGTGSGPDDASRDE